MNPGTAPDHGDASPLREPRRHRLFSGHTERSDLKKSEGYFFNRMTAVHDVHDHD